MTTAQFFEKFDLFAGAPDAVPRMRELILKLAVSGKLVPQKASEGSGNDLLEKISKAANRDAKPMASEDGWHTLPKSWCWVRLANMGDVVGGGTPRSDNPKYFSQEGIPWLTPADLNGFRAKHILRGRRCITQAGLDNSSARLLPEGTVLFSSRAPIGYVAIAGTALATNQGFKSCVPYVKESNEFLYYYLKSAAARIDREAPGTTFREVSGKAVSQIPVPLPPLAEQKRIVAKVDELMALCDQLEAQQQERETKHTALAQATLARFAEAPTPTNLNLLFHSSFSIQPSDLRKTILTLAVQGQLVPQDPKDEAAVISLSKCGVDVKRWFVGERDWRQEIPSSWTWIRFAGVGDQRLGKMLDAQKNRGKLKPYLRNTNVQWMRFELDDVKAMRVEEREEDELRLRKGDLLICEGGEPGRCAIWRDESEEMYFQKALHRVRPCEAVLSEFLALNLQIDCRNGVLAGYFTGATIKHLTGRSLAEYAIAIPPLAEQKRIVAKVEELMALIDALEAQQAAADQAATHLLDAVISELAAA